MAIKKKKVVAQGERDTVIGAGAVLDGAFDIEYDMRVEGTLRSERLVTPGSLIVGEQGQVQAREIAVGEAWISGRVSGALSASRSVYISSGSHFSGTLTTPKLVIEEGARLEQITSD
jgi:cytoskeletal protein CcmA (bactofilin family)